MNNDLVVLDIKPEELNTAEKELVLRANWYQPKENNGIILVSAEEIRYLTETDPSDAGISNPQDNILIDSVLKRMSNEDGFYHA